MLDSQYQALLNGISHDLTVEISYGAIAHGTAHNTSTRTLSSGGRIGVVSSVSLAWFLNCFLY
jgi:hypothetical protein